MAFAVTLLASSLVVMHFDPSIWTQYSQLMRSAGIEREFIPCLSVALRVAVHSQAIWLRYLPAAVATVWAVSYYWKNRSAWSWLEHGSLLMLVSILASPYAWLTDQTLVLPAVMSSGFIARTR